jgi:hypothetical protein
VISSRVKRRRPAGFRSRASATAPGLGLAHPARDENRIGARLERRAVLPQLGVALGDLALRDLVRPRLVALGRFEFTHCLRKRPRAE